MSVDISKLMNQGAEILKNFVQKNGLEGAVIATAEGLEMASYFKSEKDADVIAADIASLLASATSVLQNTDGGSFTELIINASNGAIAIKDLGNDVTLGTLTPSGYKMGSLIVALKLFIKELQEL